MLRFGTDGVRGVANVELTPELAMALGRVAARVLDGDRWAIGRDTRQSGPMLEASFAAGLASEGVDVVSLGVAPTPEVAWWSASEGAPAAMISASHNPYHDNGIKLFSAGGRKLPDAAEEQIEAALQDLLTDGASSAGLPHGDAVGSVTVTTGHAGYGAAVAASIDGRRFDGLRLVVDCAHGAASAIAPDVLRSLGAEVETIHCEPTGTNINDASGSTHPEMLQERVVATGADVGVAFDGDADRVLLVDAQGDLVDGDHIIAICAIDRVARGRLLNDTVVVTVMTNLGFRLAMQKRGISVVETKVGDRYVLEALEAGGHTLGGEQSGHLIFRDLATTGDGLLTAVQTLDVVHRTGRPLADLAADAMTQLPQVLQNVRVTPGQATSLTDELADDIAKAESDLGPTGRVLVRPSGTEPLIRVMVEAPTEQEAEATAMRLIRAVESLRD